MLLGALARASRNGRMLTGRSSISTAGAFSGVAAIFALQFFSEVPKVRDDIVKVRWTGVLPGRVGFPWTWACAAKDDSFAERSVECYALE